MFKMRKAAKSKSKMRLGLSAVSGAGKTYSALLIAYGMCNDWNKICLIDTENGSGDWYTNLKDKVTGEIIIGDYNIISIDPPFSPERYAAAIKSAEQDGIEVIIVDSITHVWNEEGGINDIASNMTGNSYTNWAKLNPRYNTFKNAILRSKCHVITTVRRKESHDMVMNASGKLVPQKSGLKEEIRSGWEYELTCNLHIDTNHMATASKDRTGLFSNNIEFKPSYQTGRDIINWCNDGVEIPKEVIISIDKIEACNSIEEFSEVAKELNDEVKAHSLFKEKANNKYVLLKNS